MGVGTWEPRVGGLTTQPGGGGPGLPTWVKLGLVLASGIRGWVLASWVRPGWAWGSGGELVGCSPAPGLGPACAQPAAPPVYGCGRARRTLEASRVAGVGPPVPSILHSRRLRCPGWAPCIVLSAPGLPCGGEGRTGQGGRVYPGLAVGLVGGRGVRTEGRDGDTEARPSHQPSSVHVRDGPASLGETPVGRLRTQGGMVRKGCEWDGRRTLGPSPVPLCARGARSVPAAPSVGSHAGAKQLGEPGRCC